MYTYTSETLDALDEKAKPLWKAFWAHKTNANRDALISNYWDYIVAYCGICARKYHVDEDEALSSVSLKMLKWIFSFDPERATFTRYLNMVVSKDVITTFRLRYHVKKQMLLNAENLYAVNADGEPYGDTILSNKKDTVERAIELKEMREYIDELIEKAELSKIERSAFEMIVCGGSYDEVSQELGISEKQLDNARSRALRKLRLASNKKIPPTAERNKRKYQTAQNVANAEALFVRSHILGIKRKKY